MEKEIFDYNDFGYSIIIYMEKNTVYCSITNIQDRDHKDNTEFQNFPCVCIYNEEKTELLYWGDDAKEKVMDQENNVYVEPIIKEVYRINNKEKEERCNYDKFILKAFGDLIKNIIQFMKKEMRSVTELPILFMVATEWGIDIKEEFLFRHIFLHAASEEENDYGLVFFDKLEAILRYVQDPAEVERFGDPKLQKDSQALIYTLNRDEDTLSCTLSVCELAESVNNSIETLVPLNVLHSNPFDLVRYDDLNIPYMEGVVYKNMHGENNLQNSGVNVDEKTDEKKFINEVWRLYQEGAGKISKSINCLEDIWAIPLKSNMIRFKYCVKAILQAHPSIKSQLYIVPGNVAHHYDIKDSMFTGLSDTSSRSLRESIAGYVAETTLDVIETMFDKEFAFMTLYYASLGQLVCSGAKLKILKEQIKRDAE